MAYMLEWLAREASTTSMLACGFLADSVRTCSATARRFGVRLTLRRGARAARTGGALQVREAARLGERFLMLNGDVLTDMDLRAQIAHHESSGAPGTLALVPVERPERLRPRAHRRGRLVRGLPREARAPTRSTPT